MARRPASATRQQPVEAPAVHTSRSTQSYVTVACKLGVARFELQLCEKRTVRVPSSGGVTIEEDHYFRVGKIWVVRGTAYPEGTPPKGFIRRPEEVEGYALTKGIPKEFWDEWVHQYKDLEMVKNRLIFAAETYDDIEGVADEMKDIRCGFSPLDMPDTEDGPVDGRVPRPIGEGVGGIEKLSVS
jgi:hypothetical protein